MRSFLCHCWTPCTLLRKWGVTPQTSWVTGFRSGEERGRERYMYWVGRCSLLTPRHSSRSHIIIAYFNWIVDNEAKSLYHRHHPIITVFPPSRWFFTICAHPSSLQCHVNSTAVCEQLYSLLRSVPCCILIHRSFRALNCFYSAKILGASIGFEF